MKTNAWIGAAEAAKILKVSRATLYAYVSRGLVRSEAATGKARERRYSLEDVQHLRARADERKNPAKAAEHALRWGVPVLESAITLLGNGALYYRGHEVGELVRTRSLAEVASLLWMGEFTDAIQDTPLHVVSGTAPVGSLPFISRAQSVLPVVGVADPMAFDFRPLSVARTGWRILNLLTSVAAETAELEDTIEGTLARAWAPRSRHAPTLLRAALIACADHELNVSAFTARCVASAAANPYAVVIAGLSALEGARHGGATARAAALLGEMRRSRDLRAALAGRRRRGETIDGFGHRLYKDGDPRATLLLSMLPDSREREFLAAFAAAAEDVLGEEPNLDFALAAVERALALHSGSSLTLFAIGRTIGWIAHAIEQYAQGAIIRPRAKYVGRAPIRSEER